MFKEVSIKLKKKIMTIISVKWLHTQEEPHTFTELSARNGRHIRWIQTALTNTYERNRLDKYKDKHRGETHTLDKHKYTWIYWRNT